MLKILHSYPHLQRFGGELNEIMQVLTKVCTVKDMVFPVVMKRCESWAIKKVGYQRIDAFKLWC